MMMNWDQQPQQYYEQRHLMNPMPSHLSPLTTDSNINNQFYQQISYHQTHPIKPHSNLTEKDNNDIVLIKVCANFVKIFSLLFLTQLHTVIFKE